MHIVGNLLKLLVGIVNHQLSIFNLLHRYLFSKHLFIFNLILF